ncbi:hypothetical protein [Aurantiacibacter spongiae]|uniref:DUF1579 domain-containing protein n=1 Tax=Aurantiacibacter spongiae TaxID=2488860 RepID=A0A3N5CSH0_9SPHN|nr:hypothetical protein [Aurantiacibacter spongiae]RPF72113.1 hypothetical protein EG799_11145 [Aurantiacibacter spongiae]
MAAMPEDLTGIWDGVFTYPGKRLPDTPFRAELVQRGGSFTGEIAEPDLYARGRSAVATVVGVVSGGSVDFTKTYRRAAMGYENPVDYVGQLSPDGDTVTGVWSLCDMNGLFEMTRRRRAATGETWQASVEA